MKKTTLATVIAFMNLKGGNGKSPTIRNLARYCQLRGLSVLLINTDKTGVTGEWLQSRQEAFEQGLIPTADFPDYIYKSSNEVQDYIEKIKNVYDLILIDTQADFTEDHLTMLKSIDLIVTPIIPGSENFEVSAKGIVMIERFKRENNLARPYFTVALVAVEKRSIAIRETIAEIEKYSIPVYSSKTARSGKYERAHKVKQTVIDIYEQATTKTVKSQFEASYVDTKLLCEEILTLVKQMEARNGN
jgi:chromosome partitioning protein